MSQKSGYIPINQALEHQMVPGTYFLVHDRGLLCRESCLAALSIESMQEALLFQSIQAKSRFLFSDQG